MKIFCKMKTSGFLLEDAVNGAVADIKLPCGFFDVVVVFFEVELNDIERVILQGEPF